MKKIYKTCVSMLAALLMVCISIYAATFRTNFNVNNYVYFNVTSDVFVDIAGKITGGAMDTEIERNYTGATYYNTSSVDAIPWRIGGVAFIVVNGEAKIEYVLEFTNKENKEVVIDIVLPILSADFDLSGGLETSGTISDGTNTATINASETAKFVYTLKLTNITSPLENTEMSIFVSMTHTEP